jgi:hypothetical protein
LFLLKPKSQPMEKKIEIKECKWQAKKDSVRSPSISQLTIEKWAAKYIVRAYQFGGRMFLTRAS